jgi:hypothetical protein
MLPRFVAMGWSCARRRVGELGDPEEPGRFGSHGDPAKTRNSVCRFDDQHNADSVRGEPIVPQSCAAEVQALFGSSGFSHGCGSGRLSWR